MDEQFCVYCTHCINIEVNINCRDVKGVPDDCRECPYNECDCFDPEDSKQLKYRPNYKSR